MVTFSNDADILRYEPILFGRLYLPGQVLAAGTGGTLSGVTFTADEADFISAQVQPAGVIYLQSEDRLLDGAFEIVAVDSLKELTISVVRADSDDEPIAPPASSNISYRVGTLRPQASEVAFQLTEFFGIRPGDPASGIDVQDILDTDVLKRASVFAVISSVYAMLASKADDENFWKKSLHYQKLFEKARQRVRLSIDGGADGISDVTTGTWSVATAVLRLCAAR
ncbi:MAG: hypothetical protein MUO27_07460 [Sedimentisphaerales bacterium]|nr:hypothetical protein [Sedimentisphaerales bacterium]